MVWIEGERPGELADVVDHGDVGEQRGGLQEGEFVDFSICGNC